MAKIGKLINKIGIPTFAVGSLLVVVLVTAAAMGQRWQAQHR